VKGLWSRAGLPTPDWIAVSSDAIRDMGAARALPRMVERLGLPLVVKPSQGGASLGVRIVTSCRRSRLGAHRSFSYHDVVLVERFVSRHRDRHLASSTVRPCPPSRSPRRRAATTSRRATPRGRRSSSRPPASTTTSSRGSARVALAAYELAAAGHVTRADLIVDHDGTPRLLELDTCPGMTETSLLPMAAQAAGWDFGELCERIVDLAAIAADPARRRPARATRRAGPGRCRG
jgi:D-alanine-D-alanine ligase